MDAAHAGFAFQDLTGIATKIKVVDAGTNPIDDTPPYASLLRAGQADLVAFAPNPMTLARLRASASPRETYLSHQIADGRLHTLHFCEASDMTSLLEPDPAILELFHHMPGQGRVTGTTPVATNRLDDIAETCGAELLKLSLQGGELLALRHASQLLKAALVVHVTVAFIPLYKCQPLFCDVAAYLRDLSFGLHRFAASAARDTVLRAGAGSSQVVCADAVFLRDITRLERFTDRQLLAAAAMLHDCYGSTDLTRHLLAEHDRRCSGELAGLYRASLNGTRQLAA